MSKNEFFLKLRVFDKFLSKGIDKRLLEYDIKYIHDLNHTNVEDNTLEVIGFGKLFKSLIKNYSGEVYKNYLALVKSFIGEKFMTANELNKVKGLSVKINNSLKLGKIFDNIENIFADIKLGDMVSLYNQRQNKLSKETMASEYNCIKRLAFGNISNREKRYYSEEEMGSVTNAPIMNKDGVFYLSDKNELNFVAVDMGIASDIYTYHLSSFIIMLFDKALFKNGMSIYRNFALMDFNKDISFPFSILMLDLERRIFKCKSIEEYLDPAIRFKCNRGRNFLSVPSSMSDSEEVTIFYRDGGYVITEQKYLEKLELDVALEMDKDGNLMIKKDKEKLWDYVFKGIHKPEFDENGKRKYYCIKDVNVEWT